VLCPSLLSLTLEGIVIAGIKYRQVVGTTRERMAEDLKALVSEYEELEEKNTGLEQELSEAESKATHYQELSEEHGQEVHDLKEKINKIIRIVKPDED